MKFLTTMHPEKCSITWPTYLDHVRSMMKELMMNSDFSDVTLVTEDKKHINANINILNRCSPVFKDILTKENNSNTLMYLRGIQSSEMESIMQFIYLGEATFYEERLDEFLAVAKSLEIKELCYAEPEPNDELVNDTVTSSDTLEKQKDLPESNDELEKDTDSSSDTIEERQVLSDHVTEQATHQINGNVTANSKYECDQCHKTYSTEWALHTHKQSVHEGVRYACDKCNFQASTKGNIKVHIQSKHDGVKYECDKCDYFAYIQSNLHVHIKSKHEGVKYACDKCDYIAKLKSNLNVHIQSKHEGTKYACDQCDYRATQQSNLRRHIRNNH